MCAVLFTNRVVILALLWAGSATHADLPPERAAVGHRAHPFPRWPWLQPSGAPQLTSQPAALREQCQPPTGKASPCRRYSPGFSSDTVGPGHRAGPSPEGRPRAAAFPWAACGLGGRRPLPGSGSWGAARQAFFSERVRASEKMELSWGPSQSENWAPSSRAWRAQQRPRAARSALSVRIQMPLFSEVLAV